MNKEDYFKYYIQGSDHYLIPKDVFKELFNEMSNWREEAKELKKQLEEKIKIGVADHKYASKCEDKVITMENQQKEFTEYMNKTIEELESDNVDDEEMKGYLIQRIDTFKEILQKYKEIIGVSDVDLKISSKDNKIIIEKLEKGE